MDKKKLAAVLGGTVLGAGIGLVAGAITAPVYAASDLVAPISYPIWGAIGGAAAAGDHVVLGAAIGAGVGVACIPLAPLNFVTRPIQPVAGLVIGALGGALIAYTDA